MRAALNNALWFKYDALNRLTEKRQTNSNGNLLAGYTYGSAAPNIGYRLAMTDTSGNTAWMYDTRGRMTQETKVISNTGGGTFVTQYGYDTLDRPQWMKYPGGNAGQIGEQVNFAYNNASQLNSVTGTLPYVQSTMYDAAGRVTQRVLGSNVLQQNYAYYPWTTVNGQGRLQQMKTGTLTPNNPTSLQDLNYTYDAVGNVRTILDNKAGPQTQTFTYDALDRLQTAQATGGTGGTYAQETYTYDPIGNLKSKPGIGVYTYTASATGCVVGTPAIKPHAVRYAGSYNFTYDCNGNMLTRNDSTGNFAQQWDKENRLITVTGSATGNFVYDGDGNRVKATLGATTTVYIGNYYEQSGSVTTTYYYAGGTRIAMRQGITVSYLLGDHLGSTSITANSSGGLSAEQRYKPWGEQRYPSGASTLPTRHQFTGQINDSEIGLYFYGARSYSSVLGRFISADTIIPNPSDPQSFNRYSYVSNSPLNYTDPSGHAQWKEQYRSDAIGEPIDFSQLQSLSRQTAIGYAETYIERNLGETPDAGVKTRYIKELDTGTGGLAEGGNHNLDDLDTKDINEDDYISISELAFTGGSVQNTLDFIATLYTEVIHSNQESRIEKIAGENVWHDPSKGCSYSQDMEVKANTAALNDIKGLSPNFRKLLTQYRDMYERKSYCAKLLEDN